MNDTLKPYRRTYVRTDDTGLYRHPLFLGAVTFGGFYGALATNGPLQIAIGAGAAITFVTYVWRMAEADRRAIEVEWKAGAPEPQVRPMEVTRQSGAARTVTVGRRTWDADTLRRIGREAERNGHILSREVLKRAGAPRDVYQNTGEVQGELIALGFAIPWGKSVRLTQRGREWTQEPTAPPRRKDPDLG